MTLRIQIRVPDHSGPYEAHVAVGAMNHFLARGDSVEATIWDGNDVKIVEVPEGTKARVAQEALERAEAEQRELADQDAKDQPADEGKDEAPAGVETAAPVSANETTSTASLGGDQPEELPQTGSDEKAAEPIADADSKSASSKKSGKH